MQKKNWVARIKRAMTSVLAMRPFGLCRLGLCNSFRLHERGKH